MASSPFSIENEGAAPRSPLSSLVSFLPVRRQPEKGPPWTSLGFSLYIRHRLGRSQASVTPFRLILDTLGGVLGSSPSSNRVASCPDSGQRTWTWPCREQRLVSSLGGPGPEDSICPGLWVNDLLSHMMLAIEILPLSFKYGFMVEHQGSSAQKSRSTCSPVSQSQPSALHVPAFIHLPPSS